MKGTNKSKNQLTLILTILLILLVVAATFVNIGPYKGLVNRMNLGLDIEGGVAIVYEAVNTKGADADTFARDMDDTLTVLDRRINSFGLTEPNITKQGDDRIRIELPGYKDITTAVGMIGKTATLEFYLVDEGAIAFEGMRIDAQSPEPSSTEPVTTETESGEPAVIMPEFKGTLLFRGDQVANAEPYRDDKGIYYVSFRLSDEGTKKFEEATTKIVNEYTAKQGQIAIVLDGEIISAPVASQVLSTNDLQITGRFTLEEVVLLANLIKGGALPLELQEVQTNVINATLGFNALQRSITAGIIGFVLIALFMILRYRLAGLVAIIALALYGSLTFLVLIALKATLTLPGIAGLILSVGMAVDANVIIFERLREELGLGKSLRAAVKASYHRAMSAIIDSNVTTLVAGVILYYFGEGAIKGFAITLSVGILLSMFTAIIVTRFILNQIAGIPALQGRNLFGYHDPAKQTFNLDFMKMAKYWISLSLVLILLGFGFFFTKGFDLGVDFTGGTLMQLDTGKEVDVDAVMTLLGSENLEDLTVIHAGENNEQILIKTTTPLDSDARLEIIERIQAEYQLQGQPVLASEQFGPAIGQEISRRAIISVVLATLAILIYVWIRFKLNYGIAAVTALVHDTLALLTVYAIFRTNVNSSFIAAILTIVGYSINDTIVIFDKIRENEKVMPKASPDELANISINQTMTRTIFTSLTTFFVILTLYIFGVSTVREFAFPLLWGTIIGSYSTIFIAGPLWVYLKKRGI